MTRSIKIAACRILFVVLCFLPILGSISFAAWQRVTDETSVAASWLSTRMGVTAAIESLRDSEPSVQKAQRVKLLDPETGQLIADCRALRIQFGKAATVLSIDSVSVPPEKMMTMWKMLHDRVLKQREMLHKSLIVSVNRLALRNRQGEAEIHGLRIETSQSSQGAESAISFRTTAALDSEPVRLHLLRDLTAEIPKTRIQLQSQASALDCSLLTGTPAWLRRFGDTIRFQGVGWIEVQKSSWNAEATGTIHGLDLARIAEANLIPQISGEASVDLRQAIFDRNRLVSFDGTLVSGPGLIDRSALAAFQSLGLESTLVEDSASARQEYERFAVLLTLDEQGLSVGGMLEPRPQRVAMTSNGGQPMLQGGSLQLPASAIIEWATGREFSAALLTETGSVIYGLMPLTK